MTRRSCRRSPGSEVACFDVPTIDKNALASPLGLSRRAIDNWLQRGLPHLKLGARRVRFDLREIEAWLQRECRTVRYGKTR